MNAEARFQDLFAKADEKGLFESYLTEDEQAEFERGTGGNRRLVNLLAAAETCAYTHNDPVGGRLLGDMADLVANNLYADFSA